MALVGTPEQPTRALDHHPAIPCVVPVQKIRAAGNRASSRHRRPLNPHRVRRTVTAPPLATSCLGASPTPAYSAWGDGIATGVRETLYGAIFVKGRLRPFHSVSLFGLEARFLAPTHALKQPSRAGAVKDGALAPPQGLSLKAPSTMAHLACRDDDRRRAFDARAERVPRPCIRSSRKDPNHDAIMRIGSQAPRRRTHSAQRC